MLDRERIILMTRMAMYEKKEGEKSINIYGYYENDYISLELLKSFFCSTISFLVVCGLYVLCYMDELGKMLYEMDLWALASRFLIYYILTVVSYGAIIYMVSRAHYAKMKHSLRGYYENMKAFCAMNTKS